MKVEVNYDFNIGKGTAKYNRISKSFGNIDEVDDVIYVELMCNKNVTRLRLAQKRKAAHITKLENLTNSLETHREAV